MSNLSASVFKLATFVFNSKLKVSTCEIFWISVFVLLYILKDQL